MTESDQGPDKPAQPGQPGQPGQHGGRRRVPRPQAKGLRIGRLARAAPLVAATGRTAGETVVAALRGRDRSEVHARSAERYAEALGRSRGVLMKAGQILSFVSLGAPGPGGGPNVYQAALTRLQDDAPPMEPGVAEAVVAAELGAPPEELFAHFEPVPMAAASIGQVHAARTKDGREIVVKVQYPGVDQAIRADLANSELLATFFQLVRNMLPDLGRSDAKALAREVSERIGEEIDYATEAANQQAFADAYRDHPFIRIPEVLPEFSTPRVLTMTRSDGMRFAKAVTAEQDLRDRWGEAIYRFTLGSLRGLRMFNADPHPGNYLFHDDGTVTFLDFGCVKRFTRHQVDWMRDSVTYSLAGDAEALLRQQFSEGFADRADPPDAASLLAWSRESLKPLLSPQPFRYTPEFAASLVDLEFSPVGGNAETVKKMALPPAYLTISRIDLGMTSVLGALGATSDWESIRREWDCDEEPVTPMGQLDKPFRQARPVFQHHPVGRD